MNTVHPKYITWKFFLLFILCVFSGKIIAQLSPGDLSKPHANLEGLENCTQCHDAGKKISANLPKRLGPAEMVPLQSF